MRIGRPDRQSAPVPAMFLSPMPLNAGQRGIKKVDLRYHEADNGSQPSSLQIDVFLEF